MRRSITLVCWLMAIVFSASVSAASSVWRITGEQGELLIGGTFHLLGPSDYPLPEAFDRAYGESTDLVLETDLEALESPVFQQRLMMLMVYPSGTSIEDHLSPDVYQKLEEYCLQNGYPMEMFRSFKPSMISVTLTVLKMQQMGLAGIGVDEHFYDRAKVDGKPLGKLETVDEQLTALASMGEGREDDMILNTLRDIETMPGMLDQVKEAWRAGDNEQLQAVAMDPMRNDFPGIYRQLLVDRNATWMPKLEAFASTEAKELVLVGALHLVGPDGILEQMRQRGYRVERY